MPGIARLLFVLACGGSVWLMPAPARAAVPEWNPVRSHPVQLGPEAGQGGQGGGGVREVRVCGGEVT